MWTKEEKRDYDRRYAAAHREERKEYFRQYHLNYGDSLRRNKPREPQEFRLPVENTSATSREVFYELQLMP